MNISQALPASFQGITWLLTNTMLSTLSSFTSCQLPINIQHTHTITTILWPLYRSTCVSWHLHLPPENFVGTKFYCPHALATSTFRLVPLEFPSTVSYTVSIPHTHTHTFNNPFSGTTRVSWYQKGKANLDFTQARDSEWQWHQLGHMQVCT